LGFADIVKEAMEKENIDVVIFDKVEPEPHVETVEMCHEIARKEKSDLVVGLGGGSAMDVAKLVSIVATNEQKPLDILKKKEVVTKPGLKKILIPSTAGTGSQVSRAVVIAAGNDKYSLLTPYAFPELAIVDPGLTVSMPPKLTAICGIDALSHAVDSLMSKSATHLHDSLALGGIELISKYLRRATFNGQDLEARYYMALGSTIPMIAMAGTLYSHCISYILAMFQPMTHGIGCGLALPYTMAFNLPLIEDKLSLLARAMGERIEFLSTRAAAQRACHLVYDLIKDLNLPVSMQELGYKQEDLPKMSEICVTRFQRPNNPRPMSKEDCNAIFRSMWEGEISYF
jgi:alcohol dehydrogenase class IV